jgi:hypothetical protein
MEEYIPLNSIYINVLYNSTIAQVRVGTLCQIINYFGRFLENIIHFENIFQDSIFHHVKNNLEKNIFLKFWHLFFKLFNAEPDPRVQY